MIRKVYSLCRRHARIAGDPVQNPDARSQARGDEPCRVGASVPSSRYWPVQSLLQRGVPANEPTPRRARRSLPRAHSLVPYVLSKPQTDLEIICDRGSCNCRRSESAEAEQRMIGPALQEPEAVTPLPQHPLLCLYGSLHLIRVLDRPQILHHRRRVRYPQELGPTFVPAAAKDQSLSFDHWRPSHHTARRRRTMPLSQRHPRHRSFSVGLSPTR
jgi:hypothetical protein